MLLAPSHALEIIKCIRHVIRQTLPTFKQLFFFQRCEPASHPADLSFWDSPQASVEVQVFSACQQLIDGVKLWAVAHVLVDVQNGGQNTENI